MAGPFGAIKKFGKNEKFEQSHSAEKSGKGDPSALNGFLSHFTGFGCVENEVLNTYGKSA